MTEAGARATFSHTGSLATAEATWRAVVRQSGAVEVASLDAMLDAVELFARAKRLAGRRMGLVAMTGGQSVVITDTFATAGLEIPALSLAPGVYSVEAAVHARNGAPYEHQRDALRFEVSADRAVAGVWNPDRHWRFEGSIRWADKLPT